METKLDRIIEVQMNEPFVVETCAYLELDLNRICQMDTASYEMEKLQSLISNLQSFYTLCRDLNQVQTTLPQNRNEEEKRIVSLQGLSKKAETIYQTVLGIQESHENIKEERLSVPTLNIESDDLSEHRQITSEASQGNQDQYDKVEEHYSADLTQQFEDENHEEAVILEDIPKRENETPMEDADESEQRPVISPAQDTESAYETGIYPGNMECSPSTLTNSMDEYQKDLIVAINRNDLASAYWISREIKNQGHSVVIPDWYILANLISQHAQWVQEDIELYQYILSENEQPIDTLSVHLDCQKEQAALLIAAASLRPALIAPESTALNWLKEAAAHLYNPDDASNKLIRLTVEFLNTGIYCNIDTFHQIQLNRSWEETAIKTAHGISEWYDDIKLRRINFAPANEVQRILLDKKGPIGEIITLICRNDFKQYKYIEEKANQYLADRRTIHQFIVTTTKNIKHSGPKIPVISGNPLEVLIRRMLELRDFIHKWVGSVTAGLSQMDSELQDWSKTSINSFVRAFLAESEQLRSDSFKSGESLNYDLNLECLIRRLFCCAINRIVSELFLAETVNSHHIIQTQTMDESNMQPWMRMLRDRLLLLNKPPIGDDGYISAKILHESIAHCYDIVFAHKSIDELFSHHLSQDDYLSARLLLDAYTNDFSDLNYANMIYAEKEAEANKRLQLKIQALSQRLVQCTIDHILSEDELSNFEGSLLSIEEGQSQRLYQYFEQLDAIDNNIERITQARKISLRQNIEDTLRSLQSEFKGMDKVLYEKAKSYIQKAGEQLELNEIALADEYLHYAERIVMEGEQSEIEPVESYPSVNYVKEFATAMDSLDKMLEMELNNANYRIVLSRMLNNKIPINGYRMDRVKSPRRHQEVVNGIAAWLELKRSNNPGKNLNKNIENLYIILSYMGYIVENTNAIRMLQHDDTSAHFEVRMSDGNISPLSAFGSDRDQRYDVILIYGRPNVHSIYQILSFYKVLNRCPIVFFMGRMRHKQRTEWSELLKSNGLTAMCIDEILIYYLASQPDSRLPAAISCGSAWSDIMPYRSFGIIPRELFKGRRNELKELSKPEGSCIVYGGRQFGKSVLLRMVEKENHRPEIGNYALYEDIKSLGDPQAYRSIGEIWVLLRERLISVGFLTNDECKKIDNLDDVIIDKIKRTPTMRLLVLLDETDMFLVEDAKNNFKEVTKFRRIMDETERRFKVVFCGLHSVQRYTAMQNHPFAQMMVDSLVVGPLEPAAARALITEPMTAIGFDMSHPDTEKAILKILCYTNYNPALIQHFCAELIRAVRKKKPAPPYIFSLSDVENVYMREGTRNFMRDRFIWTLDLDQHYMVIVFCMVLEQIQDRDGYRKEFSVREINTLVNDYWPEGFQNVPVENMRSYLH
ncbi:MAG TPA: hypothetical protein GXZ70_06110, partial [Clostridiales bacterium]|nr:hypothetical protein [Clostridiales bacterium]